MHSSGGLFHYDKTCFIAGKQSLCISNNQRNKKFQSYIFQYIGLPLKARRISVIVSTKTSFIKNAFLKVYVLNDDEDIITNDSINICSPEKWTKNKISISNHDISKLYIEIDVISDESNLLENTLKQKFWIDDINIEINDKPINTFTITKTESNFDLDKSIYKVQKIDSSILINHGINNLKNHKIIALAESIHGSKEVQEITYKLLKNMILYDNCKLVLFEIPYDLGLRIDSYIKGEAEEDISKLFFLYNYDISLLKQFFLWLKNYNKKTVRPVTFGGIDINLRWQPEDNLLQYVTKQNQLYTTNKVNQTKNLQTTNYKDITTYVKNLKSSPFYSQQKLRSILYALKNREIDEFANKQKKTVQRDSAQFQNTQFIISNWIQKNEKVGIYAHLGHLNKKNSFSNPITYHSFGNYMSKCYNDMYYVTALLVGEGYISNTDSTGLQSNLKLTPSKNGSLEKLCMHDNNDMLFIDLKDSPSASSIRFIGYNYVSNQFYPFSHKNRFDAAIFIKNSNGYCFPDEWPKSNQEIKIFFQKNYFKKKNNYKETTNTPSN